ncbi:polyphosphate:AMP phosphotransferase [Methylobacillus gramineus]|uniref:polyphosphate:AMP phosphotransferase n=1 Tax=Methylobacillus gramineus TaxID=755169 RepID=UPI001CFF99B4|nr:polyphosphate:AMP phosphotransferase [Methylobacillus gramineus]MCB5183948.1 polyphosphate:AMP phosphotransferase [Methylobacillus gramineus]
MFESAELGHTVADDDYKKAVPALRQALLDVQYDLAQAKNLPVLILIGGVDGAGKGETANLLNEWMDPRLIHTCAFGPATQDEAERPTMWRFWKELPPKGKIGIFFGSWYTTPILDNMDGKIRKKLDSTLNDIVRFERMLTDEGTLIIKLWFHLSKKQQKTRIAALEENPKTSWRVTEQDKEHLKHYNEFRTVTGHILRETSTANAPWMVIEGFDANYRSLTTGQYILDAIRKNLDIKTARPRKATAPALLPPADGLNVLNALDLTKSLDKSDYESELEEYQGKLNLLTRHEKFKDIAVITAFEGVDAAGKGGAIRRITQALDARHYSTIPIAAPTDEERAQPYLWRFWRQLPRRGRLTIFDRTWYGRVLVERVEGFCSEQDWMRAYAEINHFEEQLIGHNIVLLKFWLHIDQEEQLKRFEEREKTAFKRYKITPEDWRNREKWDEYQTAVCDMIDRTSTELSPWTLVESNDKKYARIKILKTICKQLEKKLSSL